MKDFAPYVAKIQASGADSVITGNWGSDLALLVKAAKDASLKRRLLHLLRGRRGHAAGDRRAGVDRVKVVTLLERERRRAPAYQAIFDAYKKKYGATSDPYSQAIRISVEFLAQAMRRRSPPIRRRSRAPWRA